MNSAAHRDAEQGLLPGANGELANLRGWLFLGVVFGLSIVARIVAGAAGAPAHQTQRLQHPGIVLPVVPAPATASTIPPA
jgi:hypothetical protein